ncbi:MAG: putative PLP-dependent enzyme [Parcubacteria group bacterium Gr01-1014_70]|nr:MAG: putative PLP-dependent enzyme [Parcubacteria group bacterium Gr01-1014_70]
MNKKLAAEIKKEYERRFKTGMRFVAGKTPIMASGKDFDHQEMVAMTEAVLDGWWTEGRFAAAFEKKFAAYIGVPACVTTTSGSSANLLAVAALTSWHLGERRLKPGDEVITLAAGFPTTINPLILYQLVPVFVDIDPGTYNANMVALERGISPRTKAVFLPHNIGNPFNIDAVQKLCKKYHLWLIEDCCDALGSTYRGKPVGGFGDISTFSFYAGHHMTMGEGGAVVARSEKLGFIIRSLRDWGREYWFRTGEDVQRNRGLGARGASQLPADYDHKFLFSEIGYNLKITDMQAALGLAQLKKLSQFTKRRKKNFAYMHRVLAPFEKFLLLPAAEKNTDPSWFGYVITVREEAPFTRRAFIDYLYNHGIMARMFLAGNITKQPYFQTYVVPHRVGAAGLSNTDVVMNRSFWVGIYHGLERRELDHVAHTLTTFLKKYESASS